MIDGYAPEPEEFEALPWDEIRREWGVSKEDWYCRIRNYQLRIKRDYREGTYLNAYRNAIEFVVRGFCSQGRGAPWDFSESRCPYHGFTTGRTYGSIERLSSPLISRKVREAQLPILRREYAHDEQEGRLHYIQNVVLFPHRGGRNETMELCCDTWIETLRFHEKPYDAYVDLDDFVESWREILADMTAIGTDIDFYTKLYDAMGIKY